MKKNSVWIVAVLAVGIIGFIAGMQFGPSIKGTTSTTSTTGAVGLRGQMPEGFTPPDGAQRANGAGMAGRGMVVGQVISSDDKSITVKLAQGGSQTVYVSGTTVYNELAEVSIADVSVGTTITASGTAEDDGSVTATTIMIGQMAGFGGFRGGAGAPSAGTASQ